MNLDELRPILRAYREQVSRGWSRATAHEWFTATPGTSTGQCGVTSAWLQKRLKADHGIDATYYTGRVILNSETVTGEHCWLWSGHTVIDLTADQFGLTDVVYGSDPFPEYQGEPGPIPVERLRLLEEALS